MRKKDIDLKPTSTVILEKFLRNTAMTSDHFTDLGFAKLDISRADRTGMNETIFCPGKTKEQLAAILQTFSRKNKSVLGTKCSIEQFEFVRREISDVQYDSVSKIISLKKVFSRV